MSKPDEYKLQEIKAFRDKANMLTSIHSKLSDKYNFWHTILSSFLLAVSTLLIGLTFVSDTFVQNSIGIAPNALKWSLGLATILNFCGILLLSQWGFQQKAAEHRQAVNFYFRIVNKIRQWIDSGMAITEDMIEEIRAEYARADTIPKIPDSQFLKLKQWHFQKVAISRELEKSPFESIESIKKRLSNQQKESEV
ncbi:MAG: hypothetical protein GY797_39690 [Deltaproteobacteria bacterium]|nr:hypothetical protein [Deltaproteobacteria bacterium]